MTEQHGRTRGVKRLALLVIAGLVASFASLLLAAPSYAAGASITVNTTGNLGTGQTISVSGNAGGAAAPALYVAVCETTPTASNCDQSLAGFGTGTAHIVQVQPDAVTGAWGPVNFFLRTTIVTGNTPAGYNCLTAGTCVIGQTDSVNPAVHTYDAIKLLNNLGPAISLSSATGVNGDSITVSGTGYPAANTTSGAALNTPLNVGLCGYPPSATNCDGNLADYRLSDPICG